MTCGSCEQRVSGLLQKVDGVTAVEANRAKSEVKISMQKHIDVSVFSEALKINPKYKIEEVKPVVVFSSQEDTKSWWQTYKPVLLIFMYILLITISVQVYSEQFSVMKWMNHFMAGFFICFSFFKLLNLSGFADSYAMYDVVAKQWKFYGKIYAFIELFLGIAYLLELKPIVVNAVTLIVMSVSLVGVIQSVLDKKKIKCACLGDVFNLPMSTLTIIEDVIMILMSLYSLLFMLIIE